MTTLDEAARILAHELDNAVAGAPKMTAGFKAAASPEVQSIVEDYRNGKTDLLTTQKRILAALQQSA